MSTTATGTDMKQFLIEAIQHGTETFLKDLSHIPQDKLNEVPMGCARSPLVFSAECAGFNGMVAGIVRGADVKMPGENEIKAYYTSMDTFEKVKGALEQNTQDLVAAIREMKEEDLAKEVQTPWGTSVTLAKMIHIVVTHTAYHDGQLNYIQCLYGDGAFHWAEQ